MNFLLVVSKKDIASFNFLKVIEKSIKLVNIDNYQKLDIVSSNNIYLKVFDELHLNLKEEYFNSLNLNIDIVIFLSKHSTLSDVKPRTISVHAIGNWNKAKLGGKDYTLVKTDSILIRCLLLSLFSKNIKNYEVKQEVTHHGPYLSIPSLFYEIGSDEKAWNDIETIKIILDILINVIKTYNKSLIIKENNWKEVVGYGGSHYCTKFNKLTFNKAQPFCFGHIIPNYAINDLDSVQLHNLLSQAKEKCNANKIVKEDGTLFT